MRLSTRLLSNAATTYLRLGATFVLGLFTTWYIVGAIGVAGFGLISLAFSSTGLSHALERAIRFGLVRELATAIASGDAGAVRRNVASTFRLCRQAAAPLAVFVGLLAALAWAGVFNLPRSQPELALALALLILGEGIHAVVRLLTAPWLQSLFAAQKVGLDNLLMVVSRLSYAVSAVIVFGWIEAPLPVQLMGFAISRATLQLVDVAVGLWLVRRRFPEVRLDRSAFDEAEYRSVRETIWHSSQVVLLLNANYMFLAVLINLFFGLTFNGIWQIVVQVGGFVRMFSEGPLRGIAPLAAHLQQSGRTRAVSELLVRSIRYQLAFALPAALFLGFFMRQLLELWVGGRLAGDANLASAGVSVAEALDLTAAMARIVLVVYTLRAGFLGVERVLYGVGKVRSYAWFAKWAVIVCVGSAIVLMARLDHPIAAPIAMLVSHLLYSPCVVVAAARREAGLSLADTLGRSLPRPLITSALFAALLMPARAAVDGLTLPGAAGLLAGSALVYIALALPIVPEPDERARLLELSGRGLDWLRGRPPARRGGPPGAGS